MFTPNLDRHTGDDAIIETFTREDSARATRSSSREDRLILDRKRADEWKRHLATIRSTLIEIFLWFIREVSTTEIQQDFEQVFRSHILQNQAAGGGTANSFNGDILIAHIESNVDIARFLPNRYVPDKRTMQANRDRFERKQLLQVFGDIYIHCNLSSIRLFKKLILNG